MTRREIIERLEEITQLPGFIYVLAILVAKDLMIEVSKLADINWREKLSFQEVGFLVGLTAKHKIVMHIPSEEQTQKAVNEIFELFEALHNTHLDHFTNKINELDLGKGATSFSEEEREKWFSDIFGSGNVMTEPMFYGGSGAYDFQYRELAPKKYIYDASWLQQNAKFSIEHAVEIAAQLKKMTEEKYRNLEKPKNFEDFCKKTLDVFCFNQDELKDISEKEVTHFLHSFSIIPGSVNQHLSEVGQYNTALSHPIIKLSEDLYFLAVQFHLTQSIYESPFYWMSQDSSYKSTSFLNRGKATENISYEILRAIFGGNLYRDVKVQKTKANTTTDIDVLAIAGNKAVVFQAKSKRLTELSRLGDTEQLKKDFSIAIQKAYEQGLICRNAILDNQGKFFQSDGTEIKLNEIIEDVYIVCLTSDEYPALTNQVNVYLDKGKGNPSPVVMSIFDLDIVAFYLKDQFEFLYYLRQRIDLNDYFKASSEMSFLSFHLRHKLFPLKNSDMCMIDETYPQLIDANFPALRGHHPKTKAVDRLHHKWKNKRFEQLIQSIKDTHNPGLTDAIFYLFDIAGDGADRLIKAIDQTRNKVRVDGKNHDFSIIFDNGKSGISFVSQTDFSSDIGTRLFQLSIARKYKTKANEWLGLGSVLESGHVVDTIVYNNDPWEYDETLEELSQTSLKAGMRLDKNWKKIGRNIICPCGSGKKFKKCCGKA